MLYIGVDLGTSAVKLLLMDENGKALTKEETEELLEKWFYSTQEEQGEKPVIVYKSVLLERLERNWK